MQNSDSQRDMSAYFCVIPLYTFNPISIAIIALYIWFYLYSIVFSVSTSLYNHQTDIMYIKSVSVHSSPFDDCESIKLSVTESFLVSHVYLIRWFLAMEWNWIFDVDVWFFSLSKDEILPELLDLAIKLPPEDGDEKTQFK